MFEFIKRFFPSTFKAIHGEGYQDAIRDILLIKDKIYTQTVTLEGDYQTISNCTFLGSDVGLKIVSRTI